MSNFNNNHLLALLFGLPSNDDNINLANLLFNSLVFALTQDFLWTPLLFLPMSNVKFARLGYVSHSTAKIVSRVPPSSWISQKQYDGFEYEPQIKVIYKLSGSNNWIDGPVFENASPESDWLDVVTIDSLIPSTDYIYSVVYLDGTTVDGIPNSLPLRTSPDPNLTSIKASMFGVAGNGGTKLSFASGSCVTLGFPYNGSHLRIPGFDLLAEYLKKHSLQFLLFLGDFIYADIPYSIGTSPENYWRKYRQTMASNSFKKVYQQLPVYHMYDDHEISNNYAGLDDLNRSPYREAMMAYKAYNELGNPDPINQGHHYYSFNYGDIAFFTFDTRAHRSNNADEDGPEKTILGDSQKIAFLEWLNEVNNTATFKFISSSVPLTQLWKGVDGHLDTWGGFKTERKWLLDILQYVPNVIVLTGDRHEAAAVEMRDSFVEFSTSPLSQFSVPIRTFKQDHTAWIDDIVKKEELKDLYPYLVSDANGKLTHPDSLVHTTYDDGEFVKVSTPEDKVLAYLPDGFTKWTTFDVDTTISTPIVNATIWINGKPAWSKQIVGRPIRQPSKAITLIDSVGDIFDSLGMKFFSWF